MRLWWFWRRGGGPSDSRGNGGRGGGETGFMGRFSWIFGGWICGLAARASSFVSWPKAGAERLLKLSHGQGKKQDDGEKVSELRFEARAMADWRIREPTLAAGAAVHDWPGPALEARVQTAQ
jgi:hypothetical protein